jgi:glyoxylase-like metal-dependent hydrolase (beta-lactamase superfamily II)
MCQSKSHDHHHHHHHPHRSRPDHGHAHHDAFEPPRLTRRQALGRLKAAGLVAAAGGSPWGSIIRAAADDGRAAPAGAATAKLFDFKQVAPGIFGAIARPTAMLNCNAAVIVNRDHVVVVDTHSKPSAAKALIRQIREEVTGLPVRYVVDSHLHGDHAMGNEAYPDVFGANVEVISSVKTREWLEKLGMPRMRETLEFLPKQIADLRAKREASRDEAVRAELATHIEGLEAYLKEMQPARVTLPTLTFDRRMVIHRGGREVHLLFLGRAHTAGDVVAYIPSERVVATGDLMHGLLPYMGDGFPDEWPATLRALEALDFDRVIPGHGSIQEGKGVLTQFRAYVEEITEKVSRGIEKGQTLDELKKTISADTLASLKAGGAAGRVEREMTTLFPRPDRAPRPVEDSVQSNIAEVFTYFKERKGRREMPLK